MLGFLQTEGLEVDGIENAKAAAEKSPNLDSAGNAYPPFEWGPAETMPPTPPGHKPKLLDPWNRISCGCRWVTSAPSTCPSTTTSPATSASAIAGTPRSPATPGRTVSTRWPAGRGPSIGHKPGLLADLLKELKGLPVVGGLEGAPIFEVEAFTRQLHDSQWRWYSHDPATPRAADSRYRDFRDLKRGNFAYFNRKRVSLLTELAEAAIVTHDSFLDDAAKGELRDVSWIDPNFIDLRVLDPNSNDDHPPSDVKAGQALVLEIYEALARSPRWEDTVPVVAYDEHGGFYDHVPPPNGSGCGCRRWWWDRGCATSSATRPSSTPA
jgi:hypothetical protein